ncbi:MAG: alpha/beta hydrolase [Burkholderiaceae bacterium]|jgi:pimeloyl-ACP methyl ester carboxylesterase|nr:alpha/beta hydrolase [Burkholderiaceae bacterium]
MTDEAAAAAIVDALSSTAHAEEVARLLGRLPASLELGVGDTTLALSSQGPKVSALAPLAVWQRSLYGVPSPGFQSAGALVRSHPEFRIVGDPLAVAQCLALLEMLIEGAREQLLDGIRGDSQAPASVSAAAETQTESLDAIRGRYLQLTLPALGDPWVYEESTGPSDAPAMLMLHTAGADSRQWHALMTDARLSARWRMLAFDMPWHGRSSPPLRSRPLPWRLDAKTYLDVLDAYLDAAGIARALIVGCSMGAAAGLAYLAERPGRTTGAILLEAPFRSVGRRSEFLDHPGVHAGRFSSAWVTALLGPLSPRARRARAGWIYTQAGPGVYEADLRFYSEEFDAARYLDRIDTRRTPLWLLTGEYDYSATPADGRRIAEAIPGARFETMPGLGHFPMTENPAALMTHLEPITAALATKLRDGTNDER